MSAMADRFRREGMADAAVLLVARRVAPTMDLADWGRHLDLEHRELVAAVDRFKARARGVAYRPATGKPRRRNAGRPMLSLDERRKRDARIRQMRADGVKLTDIADEVDLTVARVQQILAKKVSA